jgi:hypothetical protein
MEQAGTPDKSEVARIAWVGAQNDPLATTNTKDIDHGYARF